MSVNVLCATVRLLTFLIKLNTVEVLKSYHLGDLEKVAITRAGHLQDFILEISFSWFPIQHVQELPTCQRKYEPCFLVQCSLYNFILLVLCCKTSRDTAP